MRILLKQAFLWTERRTVDLVVEDGLVRVAGASEKGDFGDVVDLGGRIVVKGFADVHMHLDKALISGRVANKSGTLREAIEIMGPYKASMTDEDIRERAEQALLLCRANGTRFVRTNVDVDDGIGLRSLRVLKELKQKYADSLFMQLVAFPQEGLSREGNVRVLAEAMKEGADVVGGIPAWDPRPEEHIERIFDLAAEYGVGVDAHIDETDAPSSLTLELLAETALKRNMRGGVTAAHCCSLAANPPEVVDRVLDKVAEAGVAIVSLPSTNLYLQGRDDTVNVRRGIAPLKSIVQKGIRAAIASDNMQDPFNPFGTGNMLLQALIAGHGCHMGGLDDFNALFDMITGNPMAIMGLDPSWRDGAAADFIVLEAKSAHEAIVGQCSLHASCDKGVVTFS